LGIEWTEFDIEADESAAQKVEELTGVRRVPTIVIGNAILVEPTNTALDAALEAAGYSIDEVEVA
jgi:glutaredoxin